MGQSNWLIAKKKKVGLVRHPQLINVKQNKYTYMGRCCLQGVLAQAKNGDKLFWEEKFYAANGKAPSMHSRFLAFFFSLEGGWREDSICERRTTFAKAYGIKVRCYGEHVKEHIGNLKET
jgi:hypothetical protein